LIGYFSNARAAGKLLKAIMIARQNQKRGRIFPILVSPGQGTY
jgi:hypothetical protein